MRIADAIVCGRSRGVPTGKSVSSRRGLVLAAMGRGMVAAAMMARGIVVKRANEAAEDDDGKNSGGKAGIVEDRVASGVGGT